MSKESQDYQIRISKALKPKLTKDDAAYWSNRIQELDGNTTVTQSAVTGPKVSQLLVVLLVVLTLLIATISRKKPKQPYIPLPVCEVGQECKVYEIKP